MFSRDVVATWCLFNQSYAWCTGHFIFRKMQCVIYKRPHGTEKQWKSCKEMKSRPIVSIRTHRGFMLEGMHAAPALNPLEVIHGSLKQTSILPSRIRSVFRIDTPSKILTPYSGKTKIFEQTKASFQLKVLLRFCWNKKTFPFDNFSLTWFSFLLIFPTERKHDAGILADSGLLRYLTQYDFFYNKGNSLSVCRSCIPSKGSPTETLPYSGAKSLMEE